MTEADWRNCTDPQTMLNYLHGKTDERKQRLFACACARLVWKYLVNARSRDAIHQAEAYAEGRRDKARLKHMRQRSAHVAHGDMRHWRAKHWAAAAATCAASVDIASYLHNIVYYVWKARELAGASGLDTRQEIADLVRDVFGNPLRLTLIDAAWRDWHDGVVVKLASTIEAEERFADLPILADALEEAGCTNDELLAHCRADAVHVRGCWVLDLVLQKG